MIATRSTGVDHIDVAYCRMRGIVVSNVPTCGANTVAEYTFALLLSFSRKVIQASELLGFEYTGLDELLARSVFLSITREGPPA